MAVVVSGTSGDDTLSGDPGDTLVGGRGNDTFIIYDSSTVVQDLYDAGMGGDNDRVLTFVSYDLRNASIEYLATAENAGTTAINLTGNSIAQTIVGNYGNNILDGLGGGDLLYGLRGDDTYYVYDARDRIVEAAGEGTDALYTTVSYTLGAADSIELFSVKSPGTTLGFALKGNGFAQQIIGGAGNDTLDGGGGIDTLIGGAGNDVYRTYGLNEVIVEATNGGNDTVYTSGNFYLGAGVSIETISAADQSRSSPLYLLGNERDQRLIGDYGNNTLNGGGSIAGDTLSGLYGDDIYRIYGQNDVVIENAGQGNDTVYTSGNYRLAAGVSVETLSTAEHARTSGMNLTGNELDNRVIGNYGVNILDGGGGSDTLIGLEGDDLFRFTTAPVAGKVTTIQDYGTGRDQILLDSNAFAALAPGYLPAAALAYGAAATDADDRIVYNPATGALSYDADGSGAGAAIQFAQLATGIAAADLRIVTANVPADVITISTPGTYLLGNATGAGTAIPDTASNVTFAFYGVGYHYDLIFGASTSNGLAQSIRFATPDLPGRLDFSQLTQGVVTHPDQGYATAAGQALLSEPPASSSAGSPFPSAVIGTAFDDVIDRRVANLEIGGYGVGTVSGGAGNDLIRGARVADGGDGNDYLYGTIGTTLTGGAGADTFELLLRTRTPGTNSQTSPNTITDFNAAEDRIAIALNYAGGLLTNDLTPGALSAAQFGIGTGPTTADQRIVYNPDTGTLSYFVRGDAGLPASEIPVFAVLPAHLANLSADNFTIVAI